MITLSSLLLGNSPRLAGDSRQSPKLCLWARPAILIGLSLALSGQALAAPAMVSFSLRTEDDVRVADARTVEMNGAGYIPLSLLVGQFGGGCQVAPDRIQVDFAGKTAWLRFDETEVRSSLGDFSLRAPILPLEDGSTGQGLEALMAAHDIIPFFETAFRVEVKQAASATLKPAHQPEAEATDAGLEPLVELDALEPMPVAAPKPSTRHAVKTIIIDAGHGGTDEGCSSASGLTESSLALGVAQRLAAALKKTGGFEALLTRQDDQLLSQAARITLANQHKGDLLVSIHAGASYAPNAYGFEIFCLPAERPFPQDEAVPDAPGTPHAEVSREVAENIGAALKTATGAEQRGIRPAEVALLAGVSMPGVLVEVGFLTSEAEAAVLGGEAYQDKLAQGIADGILSYVQAGQSNKGTP